MEHLEAVITRYCASISTQIVFNRSFNLFSMFLIMREMIFRLMIFNTLNYLSLTNQAVFDNISLVKLEARCMLALLHRF